MIEYDLEKYENQLFYHNDEVRIEKKFRHGIRGEGLYSDFDSAADLIILKKYLEEFNIIKSLSNFSYEISK